MATRIPLAAVASLPNETPVECVAATVMKIGDYYDGHNEIGPWSFQNGELQEGTTKLRAKFKNREPADARLRGKVVYFSQGKNGDGKLSGLMAFDDEYKGKVRRVLLVEAAAAIDGTQAATPPPQPAAAPQQ